MVEVFFGAVAVGSLVVSLVLEGRMRALDRRLTSAERSMALGPPGLSLPEPERQRPLEGLRIALGITQDHTHPVFANLLKERLLLEDVAEVTVLTPDEASNLQGDWNPDGPDLLILGNLVCNGYAEIYYQADLTCHSPHHEVCTIAEKPAHGDRPANLSIELVERLKTELTKLVSRNERRRAIRELRGE
jgi:hypothetical protein